VTATWGTWTVTGKVFSLYDAASRSLVLDSDHNWLIKNLGGDPIRGETKQVSLMYRWYWYEKPGDIQSPKHYRGPYVMAFSEDTGKYTIKLGEIPAPACLIDPYPYYPTRNKFPQILAVTYGPAVVKKDEVYMNMLTRLTAILDSDKTYKVTNDTMGGNTQPNNRKTATVYFWGAEDGQVYHVVAQQDQMLDFNQIQPAETNEFNRGNR